MAAQQPLLPPVSPSTSVGSIVRVEYIDFRNAGEYREFRLRACGREGSIEFRMRIAIASFGAGRVRLQDGPAICYERLLRALADGESMSLDAITIDDVELTNYRTAHTPVPKHRATWTPSTTPTPTIAAWRRRSPSPPRLPVAPLLASFGVPGLEEGQRVSHAVFGAGVTTSAGGGHTAVQFDLAGLRTFITSMLKVDVLSAPHTWETSPRGKNRLRRALAEPASSPA